MPVYSPTGSGNVHYDVPLTNISVAWQNEGLVGDVLFPPVPVQKQANKYYIFNGREGWYPSLDDARAPGTEANEVLGLKVSLDTYYAQEHALQIAVTDEERENADSIFSPDADGAELLASRIALGREYRIYTVATTASNYNTALQAVPGTTAGYGPQWDQYNNATPIRDIRTAQRQIHKLAFIESNVAVIPYRVMSALEDSADLINRIQYVERAVLTPDLVASLMGLNKVVVPGFGYATNNPGQTLAISYLWNNEVVLAYNPPKPGLKVPAYGYEFVWGFGGGGPAQVVDRWREEKRASDIIRTRRRYDLKLIGLDANSKSICGFLFTSVLSSGFLG
jgi:hypothetical protein